MSNNCRAAPKKESFQNIKERVVNLEKNRNKIIDRRSFSVDFLIKEISRSGLESNIIKVAIASIYWLLLIIPCSSYASSYDRQTYEILSTFHKYAKLSQSAYKTKITNPLQRDPLLGRLIYRQFDSSNVSIGNETFEVVKYKM